MPKEKNNKDKIKNKELVKSPNHFPVVGIGASAGGLDAFKKLLTAIPENSGMAFVLVQHLHPSHESMLADILQKVTKIPVVEITDDIKVIPDHIYIIPSNNMLVANDGLLQLSKRTIKKNERNLPIDLFFSSLAEVHQSHSIGVVLSGTASDGTLGLKAIKDHGGITFAQEEASAAYDGMPHSAIQAGVVDFILPPEKIVAKIIELTKITHGNGAGEEEVAIPQQEEDVFKQILLLLRLRKGIDFTYYKQTTIRRRILRRMALGKMAEPDSYLKYLRENKPEQDVLFQDLLIPVTSFFRDPKSFNNICSSVFPQLIKNKVNGETLRIWVAGCSTGEEVYSIAICLKEFLGNRTDRVQIFATDISEPAIAKARTGLYTKADVASLREGHLNEYFLKSHGGYQLNKSIREMCVFAVHNFLKDPPFGKMDFISCRNVLIYMETYLQKKALTTFHYALNPKGYLLLGKSETISSVPGLFVSAVKHDKIFTRKDGAGKFIPTLTRTREQNFNTPGTSSTPVNRDEIIRTDFQKSADEIMLRKYTPAGVVVNEAMDIVHFRGKTGNYLEQTAGKPSHNLLKMAKNDLAFELRNLLHKARKENAPVTRENIPMTSNGAIRNISIEAIPLPNMAEPHYLILFHEKESVGSMQLAVSNKKTTSSKTKNTDQHLRIEQLEKELAQLREDMRSITEDQEAANEELQSANEELVSGSEELQSLNEELETGKEELQSTNEELTVVNQELISMNEQATEAREFSEAIISNLHEPLLVLDKNLRVKIANSVFYKTFLVNEAETEGKRIYELGKNQWDIPELRKLLEKVLPEKSKFDGFEVSHHFQTIGQRTMLLNAKEIVTEARAEKLILLAIEDITEQAQSEQSKGLLSNIVDSSEDAIISKTLDGIITTWNKGAEKIFGYSSSEAVGKHITILIPPDLLQEEDMIIGKIKKGQPVLHYETLRLAKNGTKLNISVTVSPIKDKDGKVTGASKIARDITEQIKNRKKVRENEEQFSTLVENMENLAWLADGEGFIYWYNKRWYDYTGTTLEEMKGWGWQKVHHPDHVDRIVNFVKEAWHKNEAFELTFPLRGNDGEYKWFLTRAFPIADKQGKVQRWIGTNTNIDEQKKAEAEIKYRKALLEAHNESSVDGILLADNKGKIISFNKRYIEIWNMPKHISDAMDDEAIIAHTLSQLQKPEELIEKNKYIHAYPLEAGSILLPFKDGKIVERHNYPVIGEDGSFYGVSLTYRDITEQKSAQTLLEYRQALLEAHNESSVDGILLVDAKGKIISYNHRFIEIWNMPRHIVDAKDDEAALAHAMTQLVHPKQFIEKVKWLYEHPTETSMDELEYKDGRIVERHGYPVVATDGSYYAWSWTFRDITDIKKAELVLRQSEENFRQLAELMPDKITIADAEGNTNYYNRNWFDYTGLTSEQLFKEGWAMLMHPDDLEEIKKRWHHSLETGNDFEMEFRILNKTGKYKWHLSRASAVKDKEGKIIKWISTATEIQGQKEHRDKLEKAVQERTAELLQANYDLSNMNQELQSFAYISSHDLQEPLRKIQTFGSYIAEKEKQNLTSTGKDYFNRMQEAAKRMRVLIEDLLAYSRTNTAERKFEKIPLTKIVEEVKSEYKEIIEEKNAIIETGEMCEVRIIPFQFLQLFSNLIGNSLKFSIPAKTVHIIIKSKIDTGYVFNNEMLSPQITYCHISIADNGIGFDPQYKDRIFNVFQRLHGKDEYPGTGIGLAIVKKIVDNHNGIITANGEINEGARFDIYIPVD